MRKDQKGFTAVEAVIIVLVVAVLAGLGWYVYRVNQKDDKTKDATSQQETNNTSSEAKKESDNNKPVEQSKTYVTIVEWGVRAEYAGEQKLAYAMNEAGSAGFSSEALEKYGSACSAKNGAAGTIQRLKPTDGTYVDGEGPTAQEAAKTDSSIVKVGDYYYRYLHPHGTCGNPNPPDDLHQAVNEAVGSLVPKLVMVK